MVTFGPQFLGLGGLMLKHNAQNYAGTGNAHMPSSPHTIKIINYGILFCLDGLHIVKMALLSYNTLLVTCFSSLICSVE